MEHWERLCAGGLEIAYDDALFRPGTDSFLLAAFARPKPGARVCDLGCGSGLLGILLLQRQGTLHVTGVDADGRAVDLARRCAERNGAGDRLTFLEADVREVRQHLPSSSFDLVISNPPYYPPASGRLPEDPVRRSARAEISCTLEDVCGAGRYLLRWGGRLALVHKPERLTDVLVSLREADCEPKRLRFVCAREGAAPSLLLVEGVRGGKPGLTVEPPLVLQGPDGEPSAETDAAYFRSKEDRRE